MSEPFGLFRVTENKNNIQRKQMYKCVYLKLFCMSRDCGLEFDSQGNWAKSLKKIQLNYTQISKRNYIYNDCSVLIYHVSLIEVPLQEIIFS